MRHGSGEPSSAAQTAGRRASAGIRAGRWALYSASVLFLLGAARPGLGQVSSASRALPPGLEEVVAAGRDVWGEAAMRRPDGASYEFFRDLLPPLRYVNADFRYYPIVLSTPAGRVKARLISNGSGVNLRGGARSWNDVGTPVIFRVGPDEFLFGGLRDRVTHPTLAEGYLPIVEIRYRHPHPVQSEGAVPLNHTSTQPEAEVYCLEAFAGTDPAFCDNAVVFVKFRLSQGVRGIITADTETGPGASLKEGRLLDDKGRVLAWFDSRWRWERRRAHANITQGTVATMAVPARPLAADSKPIITPAVYDEQRERCAAAWKELLARGMSVDVPEPLVNHAWRNLIIQNFALLNGDRIHYSAGNQYEKLYEAEGSDAALAMMNWGYEDEMRRMIVPLLDFTRAGLEYHQAGLKVNDVCRLFWQTRDAAFVRSIRPRWEKEVKRMVEGRIERSGLFPKERYCGDIGTQVHSLSANAKAWRALRDMAAVLGEMGERAESERLAAAAAACRRDVLAAVEKSLRRETAPPFVPVALLGDEPAHDPITATRIGSYWNLVINDVIGSGIFPPGTEEETWIPRYLETHGGLCMGMIRSGGTAHGFWTGADRTNPLYGTRYVLDALRRDDPERAIVSFYGMLAHGLTRNTFIGGEGAALAPVDEGGRFFYCPPNSASNAHLLTILRNLLVQDFDLDDDGRPETLRLLFATPRRWLADGESIVVKQAPTAFGPVSLRVASHLARGEIVADVDLPARNRPTATFLRIRLPDGWRVTAAQLGDRNLTPDVQGTVDLSDAAGHVAIRWRVSRAGA